MNNSSKLKTSEFVCNIPAYIIKNVEKGKNSTGFNLPASYMDFQ